MKRIISFLICIVLIVNMMPLYASAQNEADNDSAVKEVRFYRDCESQDYTIISNSAETLNINFNTTMNPYKFEISFQNPGEIGYAWIASSVDGKKKIVEAEYDEETGLFVAEGYFDPDDRYYVPENVRVEYTVNSTAPAVGSDVDWEDVRGYLAEEFADAVLTNSNDGDDSSGTIDFSGTVDKLQNTALNYAIKTYDETTAKILDEIRSYYKTGENILSYVVPGLNDSRYIAYMDLSDPNNCKMLIDDCLDVGGKAIELSMTVLDKSSQELQNLKDISNILSETGTVVNVISDAYNIHQDMNGLREEIDASDYLDDEQRKLVTEAVDELEWNKMVFSIAVTALPIIASGGTAIPGAAALFTGMIGVMSAASNVVYEHRVAGIQDEIFAVEWNSEAAGGRIENIWWDYANETLTVGGTGEIPHNFFSLKFEPAYYNGYLYETIEGFMRCPGVAEEKLIVTEGITHIGYESLYTTSTGVFKELQLPSTLKSLYARAISGSYTHITLPDGLETLNVDAFVGCRNLKSISIPESLVEISIIANGSGRCKAEYYYYEGTADQWEQIINYDYIVSCIETNDRTDSGEFILTNLKHMKDGIDVQFDIKSSTLTFLGEGWTPDIDTGYWEDNLFHPWRYYSGRTKKVIFDRGISGISSVTMTEHRNLEEAIISDTVTYIGSSSFGDCTSLKTIRFRGDAPKFDNYFKGYNGYDIFENVTATAYYPAHNTTWTADVMQNYGGNITWVPYECEGEHTIVQGYDVEATCKKEGKTGGSFCYLCGMVVDAPTVIPAKKHNYSKWIINEEASCAESGSRYRYCKDCYDEETEIIKKHAHTYKTSVTKATLTKNGKKTIKCTECGYISSKSGTIYYPKTIKLSATKYTYNGKVKTPSVTVKDSKGNILKKNTDYTVTYESGRKAAGKYTVTIKFKGNYSGTKKLYFTIAPKVVSKISATQTTTTITLKWSKVAGADGYRIYKYNSSTKKYEAIKNVIATSYKAAKLKAGTTYKFKVRAYTKDDGTILGNYSKVFTTVTKPKTPSITKISSTKGKASLTWSNVTGETGYQLYYSTKKGSGFKKVDTYKVNVAKGSKSKLTSGKIYYFKVRAYKTVDGKKIYSSWSTVKSIKIK